jgi:hypothetical protein
VGAFGEQSDATGVSMNSLDTSAPNAGAVCVFKGTNALPTTWSQEAYVKASNTTTNASFGSSLSVVGDYLVVGGYGDPSATTGINSTPNTSATTAGAAYLYHRVATTWTQEAYIKASNPDTNDEFGFRLGMSGDTIVVGAPAEGSAGKGVNPTTQADNSAANAGAVYVFR